MLNKKEIKKRAQVNIIVIVLIIVIALTLVVIAYNILIPLFKQKSSEINTEILTVNLKIKEIILFVTGSSRINLERSIGTGQITSLKFVFLDENGSSHLENVNNNLLRELESKIYYFSPFPEIGKIKSVSVYPVFENNIGREFKSDVSKFLEVPSGLISWWRLSEDTKDLLEQNTCAKGGGELTFSETNGKVAANFKNVYLNCGNSQTLNTKENFALGFWINTQENAGSIIKKGNSNINYEVSLTNEGKINFSYSTNGVIKSYVSDNQVNIENNGNWWHHVLITNMMMYIDGKGEKSLGIHENLEINNNPLLIGENFNGYLREIMIFNESLSNIQVSDIYTYTK